MNQAERRIELDNKFRSIPGLEHVYFQPPESVRLQYPCIIYTTARNLSRYADNEKYVHGTRYTVKLISKDPDEPLREYLEQFRYCELASFYTANNLNHFVYDLVY